MGRGYSGNHPRFSRRGDERYDAKEAYNKDLTASARLHYLENDRHDHTSPNHMSVNQRLDDSFGMGQNTDQAPSPMNKHTRAHRLREKAMNISERSGAERGDEYDYENPRVQKLLSKANKADEKSGEMRANMTRHIVKKPKVRVDDERSGEIRNEMVNEMIDERPDSPFNSGHEIPTVDWHTKPNDEPYYRTDAGRALDSVKSNKYFFSKNRDLKNALDKGDDERSNKINTDLQNFNNMYQSSFINEQHQADLQAEQDEKDERTRAILAQYERENNSSSPMNEISKRGQRILNQADKARDAYSQGDVKKGDRHQRRARRIKKRDDKANQSPMNACAKSEGGSGCVQERGGEWKVISNKTGKPWPANYGSKANAEAALRGYHAG